MITSGEKALALEIIKEKHFTDSSVAEMAEPLVKLYGKNQSLKVAKGLIEDKANEILSQSTVGFIVCEDNYRKIEEAINELGMKQSFSTRVNERGCVISSYADDLVVTFDMDSIEIQNLMGECLHPDYEIYNVDTFFEALEEAVSIDMRTKAFKNLCKRRAGEKYDKGEMKIDMRTKAYKETKAREDGRKAKKQKKIDEENPRNKIMREKVMGEYMAESCLPEDMYL